MTRFGGTILFSRSQNRDSSCPGLVFILNVVMCPFLRVCEIVFVFLIIHHQGLKVRALFIRVLSGGNGGCPGRINAQGGWRSIRPYEDVPALPPATPPPSDTHHTTPPSPLDKPTYGREGCQGGFHSAFEACKSALFPLGSCYVHLSWPLLAFSVDSF